MCPIPVRSFRPSPTFGLMNSVGVVRKKTFRFNARAQEEEEITDLVSAIKKVLKNAAIADGLIPGLHEVAKVGRPTAAVVSKKQRAGVAI